MVTFLLDNMAGSMHGKFRKGRLNGEKGFCKGSKTGTITVSELMSCADHSAIADLKGMPTKHYQNPVLECGMTKDLLPFQTSKSWQWSAAVSYLTDVQTWEHPKVFQIICLKSIHTLNPMG